MDIIKQLTREVRFYENGKVIQTLQPEVTANLNRTRNGIILEDVTGRSIQIFTSQIDITQKLPAIGIKFQPGTTEDLWDLLFDPSSTPFFTELHIKFGGGGEVNTASNVGGGAGVFKQKTGVDLEFKSLTAGSGITITPSTDEIEIAANVTDETNVKIIATPTYTVLTTDYILWVTVNCTITLPLITAPLIAFPFRIFSRNALTRVNPTGGDLIDGGAFVNIGKYSMYTFRAGTLTDWGLGD
jgi:hypothetical protein